MGSTHKQILKSKIPTSGGDNQQPLKKIVNSLDAVDGFDS